MENDSLTNNSLEKEKCIVAELSLLEFIGKQLRIKIPFRKLTSELNWA